MMVYGIVWILCDVSLVELHFLGASMQVKLYVFAALVLSACLWQVLVLKRPPVMSAGLTLALAGLAWWQTTDLPALDLPKPQTGLWVGTWQGLPGKSSALFQPYGFQSHPLQTGNAQQSQQQIEHSACDGQPMPYRLWVRGIKPADQQQDRVLPGQCVSLMLQPDDTGKALPAGIESWRQRNRILASMRIVKRSSIVPLNADTDAVDHLRLKIRHLFQDAAELEPDHRWSFLQKAPVLLGLVTGDRALMKPSHWKMFSDTGTSHLMAISGSHVSMFAMFVYVVVRRCVSLSTRFTTRVPAQHVALVAGWFGAFAYALLAGFNVPTQRTLVMIGVAVVLRLRGRSLLDWRAWWIALVAVTIYDPLAIFDRGAWLSFFAVALILWVLQGRLRTPGVIHGWLLVQLAIFVGLAPLLAFAFGGFPWISVVANALAIPVMGFLVVPGALLSAAIMPVAPTLAEYVLHLALALTDALLWFLQVMAQWGGAGYRVPLFNPPISGAVVTLLGLLGVLWCLAPRGIPGKTIAIVLIVPVMLGPGFYSSRLATYGATPRSQASTLHWQAEAQRQSLIIEDETTLWWVFEAGQSSKSRQAIWERWARESGVGYAWNFQQERYADWVKFGFVVHRYDKYHPLPGQVHLHAPVMSLPCLNDAGDSATIISGTGAISTSNTSRPVSSLTNDVGVSAITSGETACWLQLSTVSGKVLMAGDLRRDTQLQLAAAAPKRLKIDTLLLTPRSGLKLTGAVLNRFQPMHAVEWPSDTHLLDKAVPQLRTRGIVDLSFEEFLAQWPRP